MPIKTEINNDKQLTTHTVIGDISFEEFMATLKQFWEGQQTINVLWDFRKGGVSHVSSKEAVAVANYVTHLTEKRVEGKTALVASVDLWYGISRMAQTLGEIKGLSFQMEIFKSYEEAIQWLDEE
jgi:hypothetical protein